MVTRIVPTWRQHVENAAATKLIIDISGQIDARYMTLYYKQLIIMAR